LGVCIWGIGDVLPEWIADNQEDDVCFVGSSEDVVAAGFHEFSVGLNDGTAVEGFLLGSY
jgi:hypothetical protein